jgi:acyl-CoA synthetase (NDP forming)
VIDGGALYDPLASLLEAAGLPVFRSADRALRALGAYAGLRLRG